MEITALTVVDMAYLWRFLIQYALEIDGVMGLV
jgi:hypothetical protein